MHDARLCGTHQFDGFGFSPANGLLTATDYCRVARRRCSTRLSSDETAGICPVCYGLDRGITFACWKVRIEFQSHDFLRDRIIDRRFGLEFLADKASQEPTDPACDPEKRIATLLII